MTPEPCPICAKHRGDGPLVGPVLHEDRLVVASLRADGPPGYAFVETRRHVGGLEDLTPDEAAALGRTTSGLARALAAVLPVERVHTFVAGLGVDHLHQHVYVRPRGTPADVPWWPPAPSALALDASTLAVRLRAQLS
ncbi:HIT family protein [Microlunatus flavus]|uniref:Diadenosine tetraphosphate (Ap4A) hydrolase n=1 Tax=Microlunatus flavus TaxID=1036181 RepID=A0A1H9L2H9_9ACTN|nr:HIT family protein [Microlunatus flavus]SER05682.1 Diadenosine tetraphosphate (Ap4A) hydrolase [Microlunatus flavus]